MAELEAAISEAELREWMQYRRLQPFGEQAAFLRTGIVAAILANAHSDPKKRSQPYTPEDFMPKAQKQAEAVLPSRLLAEDLKTVFSGRIKDGNKNRL